MAQNHSAPQGGQYTKLLAGILAILIIVMIGELAWKKKSTVPSTAPSTSPSGTTASTSNASYKDGTYTADGNYQSPGGQDSIGVSITLKGSVITDVTVTPQSGGMSGKWQSRFADSVKTVVIGKKLSEAQVSNVSGSSLTSKGFNAAISQIMQQAQS